MRQSLRKDYPLALSAVRDLEIGEGWERPLRRVLDVIEPIARKYGDSPDDVRCREVTERDGALCVRMVYDVGDHKLAVGDMITIEKAIKQAKDESLKTCRECGCSGKACFGRDWRLSILCDACVKA